jgi:hypothetical protein
VHPVVANATRFVFSLSPWNAILGMKGEIPGPVFQLMYNRRGKECYEGDLSWKCGRGMEQNLDGL